MSAKVLKTNPITVEIELVIAKPDDLKEIDYYKDMGEGLPKEKVMKRRLGVPYWLINSKGEVEAHPYIIHKETDVKQLSMYLKNEQLLIAKSRFQTNQKNGI